VSPRFIFGQRKGAEVIEYQVVEILTGEGSQMFNYFFTLVLAWGVFSFGVGMLFKIINRS